MRVLIDACLPVQLKEHLGLPDAKTTREMGWQNRKNGHLLALAQQQFDVLLTMDKIFQAGRFQAGFRLDC
jgi:predicted nuclease of predicted toxin-antitoxin system